MANNCFYNMRIKGAEKDVKEFIDILTYKHPDKLHFARIFSAEIVQTDSRDNLYIADICGDCAWSVYSCMCTGPMSYYMSHHKADSTLSNISIESKRLHLDIEIYSTEIGMGFAEHYLIKQGNTEIDEEVKYNEYYYDDIDPFMTTHDAPEEEIKRFNEWKKEYNLPKNLTLDDLDEDNCICIGGFDIVYHI